MKTESTKEHGEYVEITFPVQEVTVIPQEVVGGEIWYN